MENQNLLIQVDWFQIISLVGAIITTTAGMLYLLYRRLIRRIVSVEAWQYGFELVYAKKEGNGTAKEIREAKKEKLAEWKFHNIED